jgi:3-hydroxyisobutyrate dehydrogenase-like beta-hydroxyacid dehydrogenase
MKKIGVIGLGIMGHGIADNFIKSGHEVYLWNRTSNKADDLVAKGANLLSSPSDVTNEAELVFEVTADDKSSQEIWLGVDGILSADLKCSSKTLVTCATLSVAWIDKLSKKCEELDAQFFDMPMTGGRIGAENGELVLLVGGNEPKLNSIKEELKSIAKDIKYFGAAGAGTRYKLILNTVQAIHISAFGEGLRLAKIAGLNQKKVGDALAERPGGIITNLAWEGYQNEPKPINFSVEWLTKDLSYALQMANGTHHPLLDDVLEQYREAMKEGYKDSDWTKVNKLWHI